MEKFNCPICNKVLKRLHPDENFVYIYHCNDCELDIIMVKNNKTEEPLDNTLTV